jgi:tetratricopeptide (TPR) repeat protein
VKSPHPFLRSLPRPTVLAALVALLPAAAPAQTARADLLRQQAEEAYRNGDHLRALSFLEQAYAADPQPGILANRGLILERLGDVRRAVADFEAYLATQPPAEKRATAETALRRLRPDVLIGSDRPGLTVYLDDQSVPSGTTPLRMALPVGAHLVRFEGPDVVAGQVAFIVEAGREQAIQLRPVSLRPMDDGAGPANAGTRPTATWAYVSLGAGVATAVAGGALTLLMMGEKDERDSASTRAAWKSHDDTAETYQTGAGVAFGVSVAALATGLYFWFSED